jgi:hypothetical protein
MLSIGRSTFFIAFSPRLQVRNGSFKINSIVSDAYMGLVNLFTKFKASGETFFQRGFVKDM